VTDVSTIDDRPLSVGRVRLSGATQPVECSFRVPKTRHDSVRRTELLGRLADARSRPLVLLTAPAGYGKTTLLTQWAEEDPRPCAWVMLDEAGGDPDALEDSIAGALARIGIQPGLNRSFVLLVDGAQLVSPDALRATVLDILGWLPEGSQLAISSRAQPALGLDRMRTQRMLVEVTTDDLSMSAVEAASLLRKTGIEVDFTAVQTLVQRTEGWPAALELAAISCVQRPGLAGHLEQLSGDDHLMAGYFRAELLAQLPPATVRFLMRTSVLDQLSGALCDEVLECERSAVVLSELAGENMPLRPVDARHERYRLHGLVREMLQAELRRLEPEVATRLHRRASDWCGRAGDLDRAIDHARKAEDLNRTAELLWPNLPGYLGEGRQRMVGQWLTGVAPEPAAACAPLALASAFSELASGNVAVGEQWARSAAVSLSDEPDGSTKLERAGVLIVEAWAARSGARRMGEDAARAYDLLRADSPWRASCCFLRGTAALLTGDDDEAERRLEEGADHGAALAFDAASLCLAQLAVLAAERGHDERASDFARRARSVVYDHGLSECPTSALVFAVSAASAMREGRIDDARAAVTHCLGLLDSLDDSLSWYGAEARILVARGLLALGDLAGAREVLADASRQARCTRDVVVFQAWFDRTWDQFDARAEAAPPGLATLTKAELRILRFLPTHYSFHEIGQRLHVSSNTVKTHVHAVYRKLDACSRSQAVAQARDAGLLGR
jgi:LuxR family transcriptional regulator, maltose regulon positive regulatory protein